MWHSLSDDHPLFDLFTFFWRQKSMFWLLGDVCILYSCLTSLRSAQTPKGADATRANRSQLFQPSSIFFEFLYIFPKLKVFRWSFLCHALVSTMFLQTMVMPIPTAGAPTCLAAAVVLPFLVKLIPVYLSCGNPLLLCFPSEGPCSSPGWILVLAGCGRCCQLEQQGSSSALNFLVDKHL